MKIARTHTHTSVRLISPAFRRHHLQLIRLLKVWTLFQITKFLVGRWGVCIKLSQIYSHVSSKTSITKLKSPGLDVKATTTCGVASWIFEDPNFSSLRGCASKWSVVTFGVFSHFSLSSIAKRVLTTSSLGSSEALAIFGFLRPSTNQEAEDWHSGAETHVVLKWQYFL